jgi:PAS domain S-box-containing protein
MRTHFFTTIIATACLALAWAGLFLRDFVAAAWAMHAPAWVIAVLLAAGFVVLARARAPVRVCAGVWGALALTAVSFALFHLAPPGEFATRKQWRRESSLRIAATLRATGEEVGRLEAVSAGMGGRVRAFVARHGEAELRADPTAAFALLDSLARASGRGRTLTPGTAVGLQLFARDGTRIAWAGWPQATAPLDAIFIRHGTELFYTRAVSLYRILSHVVPCTAGPDSALAAVLLVDLPLEVDYRVNNRFLKSASLTDNLPRVAAARVSLDYFPATGNLPDRLPRLREQQQEVRAGRERAVSLARARPPAKVAVDAPDSVRALALAWEDSILSYGLFPANVEPVGEVTGDEGVGLEGHAIIRSRAGNPLLNVTAVGEPLAHFSEMRDSRRAAWGKSAALVALIALFAQAMAWIPRARRARWPVVARAGIFAAFLVTLRYVLLSFTATGARSVSRLFDPSVFATPALGGLMRSVFDLAVTGVFFVALIYGLVRIVRGARDDTAAAPVGAAGAWRVGVAGLVVAAVTLGAFAAIRGLSATVVVNANPRLLGETMALTDASVLGLHVGVFLLVAGLLLTAMFTMWGAFRVLGGLRPWAPCAVGFVLVVAVSLATHHRDAAVLSAPVLLFALAAPRLARREDLVSVGIAAFALVIVASGVAYVYLSRDYDELRKGFVLEKSNEVVNPADNWKVVILEDVLGDFAQRHEIRQAVRAPGTPGVERLAFDLWADSPLSLLGYSCAIHVATAADSLVSEFSVDMPYRVRIAEGGERTDTPAGNRWAVLDLTRRTPQGVVRFYRGVVNVDESDVFEDTTMAARLLGKVIIDVPFFFESLELAARTGPRTPEVLRNVQEGGVAPRVEEPEALLFARVNAERRITESSSERVAVGMRVGEETINAALAREWPVLRAGGRAYRVVAIRSPEPGRALLAGFMVPSPSQHLLRWSTVLSLYLFYTLVILVAVVALGAIPRVRDVLPTLTPGRRLGFQQKLLASFLVVALVPAVLLGLFSVDFIKNRFIEENRDEASYKAASARKAFINLLHGELQFFLGRTDLPALFSRGAPTVRALGGGRVAMLFDDAAVADESPAIPVAGAIEGASTEDLVMVEVDGAAYIGVFSAPLRVADDAGIGSYYLYYARAADGDVLSEIAEQVGADVNVYAEGNLLASSREGLLAGGFISSSMNAAAFVEVSLLGSDRVLATERAGSYDFQVAYLPVERWMPVAGTTVTVVDGDATSGTATSAAAARAALWAPAGTRGAMGVPLLFRPESYSLEVQRATSIILGGFALLLAATIALGLVVARGVFEPLRELVAGTRRVSRGDFDVHVPVRRSDEIGIVVSAFNEMAEKVAESRRALEERRRYLEAILENIGAGVISADEAGRVRTVNTAAERIIGMTAAEITGRDARELAAADRAARIFALLAPADGTPPAFSSGEIEFEGGGRRSTVKYMRTRLEAEGRHFGTVLVFEDVTELIESKKLSAWVEMARQIAHEIKNPLTPIRLSTQFMRRAYEQKPEDFDRIFRESTDTIMQQVEVLKRIAGEFSSYGRMQRLDIQPHPIDPLVRAIVAPYVQNTTGVRVTYENGAGAAAVLADAEAVRKICANFIENAIEAMGPKGGELRVRCTETNDAGARQVRVTFRDTGPGLGEDAAKRLFEPYFSTKTTGTGLGLAICRTLSREMGGDVTVHNAADGAGVEATLVLRSV